MNYKDLPDEALVNEFVLRMVKTQKELEANLQVAVWALNSIAKLDSTSKVAQAHIDLALEKIKAK